MTAAEALNQGYEFKELRFQHGYVSRKLTLEEAEVIEGKGRRKGHNAQKSTPIFVQVVQKPMFGHYAQ